MMPSTTPKEGPKFKQSVWVWIKINPRENRRFSSLVPFTGASHFGVTLFLTTTAMLGVNGSTMELQGAEECAAGKQERGELSVFCAIGSNRFGSGLDQGPRSFGH